MAELKKHELFGGEPEPTLEERILTLETKMQEVINLLAPIIPDGDWPDINNEDIIDAEI